MFKNKSFINSGERGAKLNPRKNTHKNFDG